MSMDREGSKLPCDHKYVLVRWCRYGSYQCTVELHNDDLSTKIFMSCTIQTMMMSFDMKRHWATVLRLTLNGNHITPIMLWHVLCLIMLNMVASWALSPTGRVFFHWSYFHASMIIAYRTWHSGRSTGFEHRYDIIYVVELPDIAVIVQAIGKIAS